MPGIALLEARRGTLTHRRKGRWTSYDDNGVAPSAPVKAVTQMKAWLNVVSWPTNPNSWLAVLVAAHWLISCFGTRRPDVFRVPVTEEPVEDRERPAVVAGRSMS